MNGSEVRVMSTQEIAGKLSDTRHEFMNMRFQIVTGQMTDTSRLKQTRRLIALYETVLRERELGITKEGEK
jgi:large subunit ribosomal protein L29